jgi:hypothetical protein
MKVEPEAFFLTRRITLPAHSLDRNHSIPSAPAQTGSIGYKS